ncbi:Zn-dependent metalloprotease [Lentzea albidocapillata subsp. violacea]|uniref:Zn-dependent metalloprotease n=1 Tax=Lentzea albidocapillata subsp. violacea TaxID=128104 RepID=A0A1G9VMJ8_9PSEU|nr:M36 family metallopeptidase [Lentzea albidocapillata]SDM73025.1 Zn-dependent metalloprotease [Lentzea albidocapillata subsp. violacea]
MRARRLVAVACTAGVALSLLTITAQAAAPKEGLRLLTVRDSLTATHTWYEQTYDGKPVLGAYYVEHVDKVTGEKTVDDGRLTVGSVDVTPAVSAEDARSKSAGAPEGASLKVLPGTGLVYEVISDSGRGSERTLVHAESGAVVRTESLVKHADGTGKVFSPNPVSSQQNQNLQDGDDADSAVPAAAYRSVTLSDLDGSGYLRGTYAQLTGAKSKLAYNSGNKFEYTRANDLFEQVNAYWGVTESQRYIQSLGFRNINNESQKITTLGLKEDNSFYDPNKDQITFGTGGVDDAEDVEVVWHELGHAIQDAQVPGFGSTVESGSIGEGFGDWWALIMSAADAQDTATTPLACIMDWDATAYTTETPHCLRRTDTDLKYADRKGQVHFDGQIWSRALWDIYQKFGRDKSATIVLEAQFSYSPSTDFKAAAAATVAAAEKLYGDADAASVQAAFTARGIG